MIYQYATEDKLETIEKEYSMKEDIPSKIVENGKTYYRVWASSFIIPYIFTHPFKFDYSKSPSGRKHFY